MKVKRGKRKVNQRTDLRVTKVVEILATGKWSVVELDGDGKYDLRRSVVETRVIPRDMLRQFLEENQGA